MGHKPSKRIVGLLDQHKVLFLKEGGRYEKTLRYVISTDTIPQLLDALDELKILSVPVYTPDRGAFMGFVDVLDVAAWFVANKDNPDLTDVLATTPCEKLIDFSHRDPILEIEKKETIHKAADMMTRHKTHRLAVTKYGKVVDVVTQSDLVRFIDKHLEVLCPTSSKMSIEQLGELKKINGSPANATTAETYQDLLQSGYSARAIVDKDGKLIGALSASDLRGITASTLPSLRKTVKVFLKLHQSFSQTSFGFCSKDTTLEAVIHQMAAHHLHRLWVVDENMKPIGVVTLSDVIQQILLREGD